MTNGRKREGVPQQGEDHIHRVALDNTATSREYKKGCACQCHPEQVNVAESGKFYQRDAMACEADRARSLILRPLNGLASTVAYSAAQLSLYVCSITQWSFPWIHDQLKV